jgi:hypothetical protein
LDPLPEISTTIFGILYCSRVELLTLCIGLREEEAHIP